VLCLKEKAEVQSNGNELIREICDVINFTAVLQVSPQTSEYFQRRTDMLHKLSETIYYLSHQDSDERPLLGLVCGDQYSLVIDAGNSVQHAKDFLEEIAKLDVPPVKFLVITHGHWDHFLGMNEFTDTTVIVNSLTKEIMSAYCKKKSQQ
jgi:alkyl sulfatase BDS1-like metallo-beta-lactamase superfamily hydrolase